MTSRSGAQLAVLALATTVIAGCGVPDPYTRNAAPPERHPRASAVDRDGARRRLIVDARIARGAQHTADEALRAFARRWTNWTWRDVQNQQRELASLATGPYAAQLRADSRHAALDSTLQRARPEATGRVVAVVVRRVGYTRSGIVVTREQTFTDGAPDAGGPRYRVYLAAARRLRRGWLVTRWQPQP